ncbi:hypothetical protein AB3Z07_26750 (plasmid) [Metabacillus halosaccharovorans]|uniref:hypothetical protein n=1 Tax=Metabacillus halosaccharovorans TaxID=930124 RepID=UPI00203BE97D|nr:hypothetical protein [Metabacillus halosaccharovorans]MCM3441560.1 hypothetical protein [Metabacillus halosaccharovorans]
MKINYQSDRDKKIFTDTKKLNKKYGQLSIQISQRILQLQATVNLGQYLKIGLGKPHFLQDPYKGDIGISISKNYRLIVKPIYPKGFDQSSPNFDLVKEIIIVEVVDYHGK